ncbi:hypothetical protein ABK040_015487 [Willaertia magna]
MHKSLSFVKKLSNNYSCSCNTLKQQTNLSKYLNINNNFKYYTTSLIKRQQNNNSDEEEYPKQPGQPEGARLLDKYNLIQYDPTVMFISGYAQRSFFVGNTRIFGSAFFTKTQAFIWDVSHPDDITIESLSFAEYLNPTPTVLIVGTGQGLTKLSPEIHQHFRDVGIVIEEMNSVAAIGTFNVLVQEGRDVCCACISLEPVEVKNLTPEKTPQIFMEINEQAAKRQVKPIF